MRISGVESDENFYDYENNSDDLSLNSLSSDPDFLESGDENEDEESLSFIEDEFILRGDIIWDEYAKSAFDKNYDLATPILDCRLFEVY